MQSIILGQESPGCYGGSHRRYMNGVWIGLSRPNSDTTIWNWKTPGETEDQADLPFSIYTTYYAGSQEVSTGNCGLAAYTTAYAGYYSNTVKGYRMAACSTSAYAVCMKVLS